MLNTFHFNIIRFVNGWNKYYHCKIVISYGLCKVFALECEKGRDFKK